VSDADVFSFISLLFLNNFLGASMSASRL
jgi:hypothetical protein